MEINREAFIDNYLAETKENIRLVNSCTIALKKNPESTEDLNTVLRALHTIKGSSRMLKFSVMENLSHGLENVYKGIKEQRYPISPNFVQLVFIATDYLQKAVEKIKAEKSDEIEIDDLQETFRKAYSNEPYSVEQLKKQEEPAQAPVDQLANQDSEKQEKEPVQSGSRSQSKAADKPLTPEKTITTASPEYESVRIRLEKVNKMIRDVNTVIIKQFQFKQVLDLIKGHEQKLYELFGENKELLKSSTAEAAHNTVKKWNQQLKAVQTIKKSFQDQMLLIERGSFELQEDILSLRMLPLELILGSLDKMVEESAMSLGKEIDFQISGMDVMLDKVILEKLNDPIIHLVRNSIDHGIETPEIRQEQGKNKTGKIHISCTSEGGSILITIEDDGRGINFDKIRKKAIRMNYLSEEEAAEATNQDLTSFLFMPGFSTKNEVTQMSGRGVGLDIVKFNIERIKGKISIDSTHGEGTRFTLTLPLSLATVEGFFIRAAGNKFFIPATFVKKIVLLEEKDKLQFLNRQAFKLGNKIIPMYSLGGLISTNPDYLDKGNFVLVVESLGEIIGITVDQIIQHSSLIYKPVPKVLQKMKVIQGIVFDESFNIINILFIPDLIHRFKGLRTIERKKRYSSKQQQVKTVLVVDDSLNTREIEKSILELENYKVITAVDGIDGLNKLKANPISAIVTDLNMPRMDGYTLIENIRKEKQLTTIPIIVISSIDDKESRDRVMEAGADSYIIKSHFDRNDLVSAVKKHIG
ncbi:MAG: response regulator [Spirochaetia bacterium]